MMRTAKISAAFILLLCIYLGFSHLNWLASDNTPQRWDESIHLGAASGFKETIQKTPLSIFRTFLSQESYYPPLVPFLASFFGLANPSQDSFTAIMAFFLCGCVIFIFLYARGRTGVLQSMAACAIFAAYPLVIRESHFFMFDLPLTFFFTASIYLLERTNSFTDRKFSAIFGFACGLGMLVKWTFFVYMLMPLALELFNGDKKGQRKGGLLIACAVFLITAAPWYIYNCIPIIMNLIKNVVNRRAVEGLPEVFSGDSFVMYFGLMPGIMSWPLLALFIAGAASTLLSKEGRKLATVAFAGLILLILIPNKKDRYLMPLLPVFAVISVYAAGFFRGKKPAVALVSVAAVFALLSFAFSVNDMPFPWPDGSRPSEASWHVDDFISRVSPGATLAIVPDFMYMNNSTYSETARDFYPEVRVTGIFNFPMFTDYFLVKTGDLGPEFSGGQKRREILKDALDPASAVNRLYSMVYETALPDGSKGMLFKRKDPEITDGESYIEDVNVGIMSELPLYVRGMEKFSFRADMNGPGAALRISFKKGIVGDFKHKQAGLIVRDAAISIDGLRTDRYSDGSRGLKILSVGTIHVDSLTVSEGDLADLLKVYAGKFSLTSVKLDKGIIEIKGSYSKIDVDAAFTLSNPNPGKAGSDIVFKVVRLKAGWLDLPAGLVNFALKDYNPLLNRSNSPIKVVFGRIIAENGYLVIK